MNRSCMCQDHSLWELMNESVKTKYKYKIFVSIVEKLSIDSKIEYIRDQFIVS